MVQNKEEWSRLIGYGSGLEIVKFSLTKPEWAAPALGPRGKWGDKEQLASPIGSLLDSMGTSSGLPDGEALVFFQELVGGMDT